MKKEADPSFFNAPLIDEIKTIIQEGRQQVAQAINAGLTATYWHIGQRIQKDILQNNRAEYGEQVVATLSRHLTKEFGKGWSVAQLRHCLHFAATFPDFQIVYTLCRQLSWSHFRTIMYRSTELERAFYAEMCRLEKWSVRTLRSKIDSMLFERTAISKKPEELAKQELAQLREEDQLSPDLVFRDHYVLDFLGLKDTYSEKDLEAAIITHLQDFLLELGNGFSFVARQKRIHLDGDEFFIDLEFYNRLLQCFVIIEIKTSKLTHQDVGQLQMYVNYYDRIEKQDFENSTIGILLCANKNDTVVKFSLPEENKTIIASKYQLYLPTEQQLIDELKTKMKNLREEQ